MGANDRARRGGSERAWGDPGGPERPGIDTGGSREPLRSTHAHPQSDESRYRGEQSRAWWSEKGPQERFGTISGRFCDDFGSEIGTETGCSTSASQVAFRTLFDDAFFVLSGFSLDRAFGRTCLGHCVFTSQTRVGQVARLRSRRASRAKFPFDSRIVSGRKFVLESNQITSATTPVAKSAPETVLGAFWGRFWCDLMAFR